MARSMVSRARRQNGRFWSFRRITASTAQPRSINRPQMCLSVTPALVVYLACRQKVREADDSSGSDIGCGYNGPRPPSALTNEPARQANARKTMQTPQKYRENAQHCRELLDHSLKPEVRIQL